MLVLVRRTLPVPALVLVQRIPLELELEPLVALAQEEQVPLEVPELAQAQEPLVDLAQQVLVQPPSPSRLVVLAVLAAPEEPEELVPQEHQARQVRQEPRA